MSGRKIKIRTSLLCWLIVVCKLTGADIITYRLDESWPKNSSYFTSPISAVAVNQQNGDVFVAKRNLNSSDILQFSKSGDFIGILPITEAALEHVHGLAIQYDYATGDPLGIWATDFGNGKFGYTVKQYSLDGSLMQVIGTPGVAGSSLDPLQFGNVAEVAFDDQNLMYIVDGDGGINNRMVKLNAGYKVQWSFGQNGTGKLDFRRPHDVTILQREGILWMADTNNNRLQTFDVRKDKPQLIASCQMTEGLPLSVRFSPDASHLVVTQMYNDTIAFVANSIAHPTCQTLGLVKLPEGAQPHLVDVDLTTGAFYAALLGSPPGCRRYIPV